MTFLGFLISLVKGIVSALVWRKKQTAEQLGIAEERSSVEQKAAEVEAKEAQAAENAPVSNEAMIDLLKKGQLILAVLCMSSCASAPAYPTCLPLRQWSVVEQQNAAADLGAVPADSPLQLMIRDYATMRAETKACQETMEN